jgi:DNA-directed RNA polymerase specialized sigma24 family protein
MNIYKEILDEIELHENLLDCAEISYKYYNDILNNRNPKEISGICYDAMPKGARIDMDLVQAIDRAHKWASMIDIESEIIKNLENKKMQIDECINNISDIREKVIRLRSMGLTQEQVAELVDRSDRQIRNIEKKAKTS